MDARMIRGLQIAQTSRIRREGDAWVVPSQSGNGSYNVVFNGHEPNCNCPDCELRRTKCKHIWAVEYYMKQEIDQEGNRTTTQAVKMTYSQDWASYDKAQTREGTRFMELLADLCSGIENKPYKFGRPTLPMADMVFSSALKVYSTFSLRRFTSLAGMAKDMGFIDKVPHYSSVARYMENEELTPILLELIKTASLPLNSIETSFAVDSSGFSTCRFKRWYDFKYGRESKKRIWVKANIACGTKTNIVTAIETSEAESADITHFRTLVEGTAENFGLGTVTADKAYSSRDNLELVNGLGGEAYIPFRSNVTGKARGSMLWKRMYHLFMYKREEFMDRYHTRSNVETVFHMVKAKFWDSLKSKTKTAQINEVLLKFLCHNICVVNQEIEELGIRGDVEKVGCVLQK